jgi:hypothetical protein
VRVPYICSPWKRPDPPPPTTPAIMIVVKSVERACVESNTASCQIQPSKVRAYCVGIDKTNTFIIIRAVERRVLQHEEQPCKRKRRSSRREERKEEYQWKEHSAGDAERYSQKQLPTHTIREDPAGHHSHKPLQTVG